MVNYIADGIITDRLHAIRKEEGRADLDWRTATEADLDAVAGGLGLVRNSSEGDYTLRNRIRAVLEQRAGHALS